MIIGHVWSCGRYLAYFVRQICIGSKALGYDDGRKVLFSQPASQPAGYIRQHVKLHHTQLNVRCADDAPSLFMSDATHKSIRANHSRSHKALVSKNVYNYNRSHCIDSNNFSFAIYHA